MHTYICRNYFSIFKYPISPISVSDVLLKVYCVCSRVKVSKYKLSKKGWAYFLKCCHDKLNLHESSFFVDLTHHLLVSSFLFFFAGKRDKIASCWFSPATTTEQHKREVNRREQVYNSNLCRKFSNGRNNFYLFSKLIFFSWKSEKICE